MRNRFFLSISLLLIALATLSCIPDTSVDPLSAGGAGRVLGESATVAPDAVAPGEAELVEYIEVESQTLEESDQPPFVLSEGQPDWDGSAARPPLVETTALSQEQIQNLLTRLPSLTAEEGDVEPARLPDQSLPPPRPGVEVDLPFPPPQAEAAPEDDADAPLELLRFSPEGDVPLAPHLSVTFNQPMVPLSSHQELAQEDVPVQLSPAVAGHWRWLGTKTLLFETDEAGVDRLPMATIYTVEIPAGTESANGKALAESVSWTFRTPAATLQTAYPTDGTFGVEPVFFAAFDQRIDPAAVIEHTQLTASGHAYGVRLASADEIAADARVRRLVESAQRDRWLAFVSEDPLPRATTVTVTFGAGTPSAEGPLVSAHPQSYSFQTPGPFALRQHECGSEKDGPCPPSYGWGLEFSNPIDAEAFDPALISIEPELGFVMFHVFDDEIWIFVNPLGGTTYNVTVAAGLSDQFGQMLEDEVQVQFRVGAMEASLHANAGSMSILDPYSEPAFSIYTANLDAVKVRAFRVGPEQIDDYVRWRNDYSREEWRDPPGELVVERTLEISGGDDLQTETRIDLSDALPGDTGHIILHVAPAERSEEMDEARPVVNWIQATRIGLDAFVDANGMHVWANRLADGAPLSGVEVTLWPGDASAITDESGLALLPLAEVKAQLLIARNGDDVAFLTADHYIFFPGGGYNSLGSWHLRKQDDEVRYYVFDDRQIYRPGETVSIKGWVRQIERGPEGDVGLLTADRATTSTIL